jgi:hypothetical protein
MSYYDAETQTYTQGWDDIYFVVFWIVIITGARVAVMDYIFRPLARAGGVGSKKTEIRFAEQGWLIVYYSVFWTLGMVSASYPSAEFLLDCSMIMWLTSLVSHVQLRLLVESQGDVDPFSNAQYNRHNEMVLLGTICILGAATSGRECRGEEIGLLAICCPPRFYELLDVHQLRFLPD